jgi:hypothetical protein
MASGAKVREVFGSNTFDVSSDEASSCPPVFQSLQTRFAAARS